MPSAEHERFIRDRLASLSAPAGLREARDDFEALLAKHGTPADSSIESFRIGENRADWITTPVSRPDRVVLYLHGGGYMLGSNVAYRGFCARLAHACCARVLVLDYRLAPEHPFPAALEDSLGAHRWLLGEAVRPEHIVVAGDSAGGGLALATLVSLRDEGVTLPSAAVLYSPWLDLECTGASHQPGAVDDPFFTPDYVRTLGRAYAGSDTRHPLAAPLHADLSHLPPMLVFAGTREILRDDATRLADRARAGDTAVRLEVGKELIHAWPIYDFPESAEALATTASFLDGL